MALRGNEVKAEQTKQPHDGTLRTSSYATVGGVLSEFTRVQSRGICVPFLRLTTVSASRTDRKGLPCPFSLHAFETRRN